MYNRKFWIIVSSLLFLIGLIGGGNILLHGEHVIGTSDYVPWGALIAGYIFFVGASAGLSLVAALGHIFKFERFEVIGKRAILGGIALLAMGFFIMAFELSRPLNMIYLMLTPNLSSAIFWMGAIYSALLVLLLVEFYFVIKGNHKFAYLIGLLVIITDIAAHSNLGAVFGNIGSRPFWNGPFIPIYLIVLAILLGLGVLSVMFYVIDKKQLTNDSLIYRNEHIVTTLGKLMALFIVITFFFSFWNLYTNYYGQMPGQYDSVMALLMGPLSINFWLFEVLFMLVIPIVILFSKDGFQPKKVFIAGILTIIGNLFARINLVLAGQIVPREIIDGSKSGYVEGYVSLSEWAVLIGAIGGSILIYLIGDKYFNLDMDESHEVKSSEHKIKKQVELN